MTGCIVRTIQHTSTFACCLIIGNESSRYKNIGCADLTFELPGNFIQLVFCSRTAGHVVVRHPSLILQARNAGNV